MAVPPSPRRRHSPGVYRRRRLTVLLIALMVVAGLAWLLIAQPWRTAAQPHPAPTEGGSGSLPVVHQSSGPTPAPTSPPTTPGAAASPSPSASVTACRPAALRVQAVTDRDVYPAGQNPQLSISLTNAGTKDCTLDVGTATQVFTVTSGSDVWWRSTDCQTEPSSQIVLLTAGQTVTSAAPVVWDRTRSSVQTCSSTQRPRAPAGGASYHLSVSIAGVASPTTKQFQLY